MMVAEGVAGRVKEAPRNVAEAQDSARARRSKQRGSRAPTGELTRVHTENACSGPNQLFDGSLYYCYDKVHEAHNVRGLVESS